MNSLRVCTYLTVLVMTVVLFNSCGSSNDDASEELLQQFFMDNNISPQRTASGLYYVIDEPGSDQRPTRSTTVLAHYHGYLLNGEVFDSSIERGMPVEVFFESSDRGLERGHSSIWRRRNRFFIHPS